MRSAVLSKVNATRARNHEETLPRLPTKSTRDNSRVRENDNDCIFRNSTLYRSVFVYPSPGETQWTDLADIILSPRGRTFTHRYPWQDIEDRTRANGDYHFRLKDARAIQYTTELLVRDLLSHPDSCLRTDDPETASLFYVPYMVSVEWHNGT